MTVPVPTVAGGAVALRCDVRDGSPSPTIQWFMGTGATESEITPSPPEAAHVVTLYLDNGRYLFIHELTPAQRNQPFHCRATDLLLNNTEMRSPITYDLNQAITNGTVLYRGLGDTIAEVGSIGAVPYAEASATAEGVRNAVVLSCSSPPDLNVQLTVDGPLVLRLSNIGLLSDESPMTYSCTIVGGTSGSKTVTGTLAVFRK